MAFDPKGGSHLLRADERPGPGVAAHRNEQRGKLVPPSGGDSFGQFFVGFSHVFPQILSSVLPACYFYGVAKMILTGGRGDLNLFIAEGRALRRVHDLRQADVARHAGRSIAWVSLLESGRLPATPKRVDLYKAALDLAAKVKGLGQ